jgi:hypothetical protein
MCTRLLTCAGNSAWSSYWGWCAGNSMRKEDWSCIYGGLNIENCKTQQEKYESHNVGYESDGAREDGNEDFSSRSCSSNIDLDTWIDCYLYQLQNGLAYPEHRCWLTTGHRLTSWRISETCASLWNTSVAWVLLLSDVVTRSPYPHRH